MMTMESIACVIKDETNKEVNGSPFAAVQVEDRNLSEEHLLTGQTCQLSQKYPSSKNIFGCLS